jgi:glycosyltransferase involved in cell wall biosynthesis
MTFCGRVLSSPSANATGGGGAGTGAEVPGTLTAHSTRGPEELENLGSVVIVHDYLNQRGGAERVVLEMASMWPRAPIYTSLYRPDSTFPEFRRLEIRTTFLDAVPVDRGFRSLFPLYAPAFAALGTLDADVIVSSSSGWAHWIRSAARSLHVVYCYTPARWLYGGLCLGRSKRQRPLRPLLKSLRRADRTAARRADLYLTSSEHIRRHIRNVYGLDAVVVPPPVDTARFTPRARGERLLVVSRLLAYKRIDLVVDAATQAGLPLDVVGAGPELGNLRARAGPTVTFHGELPDDAVTELMETCRAFVLPGAEDFGITPLEANAAGKPVVAFAGGGALETLEDGCSAAFFSRPTSEALLEAIPRCDAIETAPERLAFLAQRFSAHAFRDRLRSVLSDARAARV